jgi:hypothetical protein
MDPVVAQYSNKVVESLPEATAQKKLLLDNRYGQSQFIHLAGTEISLDNIFPSRQLHII